MKALILIATAGTTLILTSLPVTGSDVAQNQAIRVVAKEHKIVFPDRLIFRLQAESNKPITGVEIFYRISGSSVQSYGYPTFTPGTNVMTEFSIKTSGTSYIPSGLHIEYFYRITDSTGNLLETEQASIAYRDPAYAWQELHHGDLVVVWHDINRKHVEKVVLEAEKRLVQAKAFFGIDNATEMKAIIVNNTREAQSTFPFSSDTAKRRHIFGGFAFGEYGLFMMHGINVDTMVHEATHLLLDQLTNSKRTRMPDWLNEGLAMQFESDSGVHIATVRNAVLKDRLLKLKNMGSVPGKPQDIRIFYAQSWSTVDYLIANYGRDRIRSLLTMINSGEKVERALGLVYGISIDELDMLWRERLINEAIVGPKADSDDSRIHILIYGMAVLAIVVTTSYGLWQLYRMFLRPN